MGEHREPVQNKNSIRPEGYGFELNEPDIRVMAQAFINLYKKVGRRTQKADHSRHKQNPPWQA
ncbi:hypothetical protein [Paenibacillus medicaginis]|uniref:Uncharacterized protein n=1 Tax=Paenibacillus medicaginis TaxID=1470560 RepID=A0ABV5C5Q3_9BACL